jgi:tetratricopeptide (TPR) repeat protein
MRKRAVIIVATGVVAMSVAAALAQSTDIATCDRLAAYPDDPDKPTGVAGNYEIPAAEIATALKACKAASGAADAPQRIWFELGRAHEFSRQPAEALKAYRKAIDAGSTSAMVGLGGVYANGSGVKANAAEARKLFEQAAAAGNPLAMANLGSIYGAGVGVPVDFAKARSWYEKAAAANSAEAMFQLGMTGRRRRPERRHRGESLVRESSRPQSRRRAGAARRLCGSRPRRTEGYGCGRGLLQKGGGHRRRGCAGRVEAAAMPVHAQGQKRQGRRQHLLRRQGLIDRTAGVAVEVNRRPEPLSGRRFPQNSPFKKARATRQFSSVPSNSVEWLDPFITCFFAPLMYWAK